MGISSSLTAAATGGINETGTSVGTADFATTSTSFVDVTNPATLTLVTTEVCTILAYAQSTINTAAAEHVSMRLNIDGTAQPESQVRIDAANQFKQLTCIGRKTGVAAGNVLIKLQLLSGAGNSSVCAFEAGKKATNIIAIAIEE